MKKRFLSTAIVTLALLTSLGLSASATDSETTKQKEDWGDGLIPPACAVAYTDWRQISGTHRDAVRKMTEACLFEGDERARFNPDDAITREQMATLLCRMRGQC